MPLPLPSGPRPALRTAEGCALFAGLILLACFQHDTWPVRFANSDDLETYQITQAGGFLPYLGWMARSQGRFYQLWNLGLIELLNHIASPFWFGLVRTALLGLEFALGAWLLARLAGDRVHGWLFWVVGLGTLQIPPGFYLVLSYPSIAFGFVALLTAALAYDHALAEAQPPPRLLVGAAIALVGSLLMHEVFAVFALGFPLLLRARRGRDAHRAWRTLVPLAAGLALYFLLYAAFRWHVRDFHNYPGTTPSFSARAVARCWFLYTFSVVPGFELWIVRSAAEFGPTAVRDLTSVREILLGALSPALLARTALVAVPAGLLLRQPAPPPPARLAPSLLFIAALACVPVAFTAKYQVWATTSQIPYAYGFYVAFFAWAAACVAMLSATHAASGRRRRAFRLAALLAISAATFCAHTTNPRVLRQLLDAFNRPAPALSAVAPR